MLIHYYTWFNIGESVSSIVLVLISNDFSPSEMGWWGTTSEFIVVCSISSMFLSWWTLTLNMYVNEANHAGKISKRTPPSFQFVTWFSSTRTRVRSHWTVTFIGYEFGWHQEGREVHKILIQKLIFGGEVGCVLCFGTAGFTCWFKGLEHYLR